MVNELRIGNFVVFTNSAFGSGQGVVSAIQKELILTAEGSAIYPSELKPIELTEEWLLKFGFVESAEDYYEIFDCVVHLIANRTFIGVGEYPDSLESELITPLYVHQLQNLYFALTQKELCLK